MIDGVKLFGMSLYPILLLLLLDSFSHQHLLITFHWSLRDSKPLQVSRTLHSNLADLNNAVV